MSDLAKNTHIVEVAVLCPLPQTFDYLPNPKTTMPLPGARVQVPFGKSHRIGIVWSIKQHSTLAKHQLKSVTEVLDEQPLLSDCDRQWLQFASQYYCAPIGEWLALALPTALKQAKSTHSSLHHYQLNPNTPRIKLSDSGVRLVNWLEQHGQSSDEDLKNAGFRSQTINALINHNVLTVHHLNEHIPWQFNIKEKPPTLNQEQQNAVEHIAAHLGKFQPFLLDGVTGSGKTEVYLQAIAKVLAQQQQALVLVPEISLTPQTIQRFEQRFDVPIAVVHSGLTAQQRLQSWQKIRTHQAGILIGTRSALFTPFANLGLIIIDEEHDLSFKQQDGLRYFARDLAIKRAQLQQIPILLGSATPSLESLHNALSGRYQHLRLSQRATGAKMPDIKLVDIRRHRLTEGLSAPVIEHIRQHLANHKQVLIFLNRRGYSPVLTCHLCGWIATCKHCDKPYTLHFGKQRLHCHFCDHRQPLHGQCPSCHADELIPIGLGTERIEQALQQQFADTAITRIDRDTVHNKQHWHQVLQDIHDGKTAILIGTQMLAKGHHFPNVSLAIIIDGDSGLYSTDFRASERFSQLLAQVSGRAGREAQTGTVLIQTRHPDHPLLNTLIHEHYQQAALQLLKERQATKLPPYSYLTLIRAEAKKIEDAINLLKQACPKQHPDVMILGPIPAPNARRKGYYRAQLLLHSHHRAALQAILPALRTYLQKSPKRISWSIDRDPQEMA